MRDHDRRMVIATGAMWLAAALHAMYITAIGGDYMHGRLLLPAFFAFAIPASVVVRKNAIPAIVATAVVGAWALVSITAFRPPAPPVTTFGLGPAAIADWRVVEGAAIKPKDVALGPNGNEAKQQQKDGVRGFFGVADKTPRPAADPHQYVMMLGSIGVPAYDAGTHVWVVDIGGLAEPLAARTAPVPGRQAGHRKQVDDAWYGARFTTDATDPKVVAARHALACGPGHRLIEAVDGKLTPGRFLSNMFRSVSLTRLHVPSDPTVAEREWCG